MSAPKVFPLSLNGDTFNALKSDFDQMLRQLLTEMDEWDSEDADITIKVHVKREKDRARDMLANGYDAERDIIKPTFKHEVSSVMQAKNKKNGSLGGNYELVWDRDAHQYIMREIENGQMSMFDQEEPKESGAPALPAPENVIDAAFTEVENEGGVETDAELKRTVSIKAVDEAAYEYFKQFVGASLSVVEVGGEFGIRTEDGKVVAASSFAENDTFYCEKDTLADAVGVPVECAVCNLEGHEFLAIIVVETGRVLFGIYVKEEEPEESNDVTEAPNDEVGGADDEDKDGDGEDDLYYGEPEE